MIRLCDGLWPRLMGHFSSEEHAGLSLRLQSPWLCCKAITPQPQSYSSRAAATELCGVAGYPSMAAAITLMPSPSRSLHNRGTPLLTPIPTQQATGRAVLACAGDAAAVHTAAWPLLQDLLVDGQDSPLSLHISSSHILDRLAVRAARLHIATSPPADLQRVRSLDLWWQDAGGDVQAVAQAARLRGPVDAEDGERMR